MIATTLEQVMTNWAKLKEATVKPNLKKRGRYWILSITDEWPSVDDAGMYYNSRSLDEQIAWAVQELSTWTDCNRTAWDMWQFKYKKDAEKFITIYYLKWAR